MSINPDDVSDVLRCLIPVAEVWGVGDDYERERRISSAEDFDLRKLIHCIDGVSDEALFGWLEGEESYSETPSDAYVAFTCLTMAIDSAKLELLRRR